MPPGDGTSRYLKALAVLRRRGPAVSDFSIASAIGVCDAEIQAAADLPAPSSRYHGRPSPVPRR